ncbi:MAG: hypothetical protein U9N85_06420 [Bacteroidota bacterium]|nr:hypothetical protein [Bacteroidota bacterium]
MPEKEQKRELNFERVVLILLYISIITLLTYAVMAVITHFSLNYSIQNYSFTDSLKSVTDTNTAMFKFFFLFVKVEAGFTAISLFVWQVKKYIL